MASKQCIRSQLELHTLEIIRDAMACMFEEGLNADIQIESQNDLTLAHRSVLSGMSPVFKAMFSVEQADGALPKVLKLDEIVTTKALRAFLRLLYVGVLDRESISWEHGLEILAASHKYELPLMKAICASALGEMLTVQNCLRILEYADSYDSCLLKRCKKFVAKNFKNVVLTDGFEDLATRKPALLVDLIRSKIECSALRRICRCLLVPLRWAYKR